jgi:hypothetical protein
VAVRSDNSAAKDEEGVVIAGRMLLGRIRVWSERRRVENSRNVLIVRGSRSQNRMYTLISVRTRRLCRRFDLTKWQLRSSTSPCYFSDIVRKMRFESDVYLIFSTTTIDDLRESTENLVADPQTLRYISARTRHPLVSAASDYL